MERLTPEEARDLPLPLHPLRRQYLIRKFMQAHGAQLVAPWEGWYLRRDLVAVVTDLHQVQAPAPAVPARTEDLPPVTLPMEPPTTQPLQEGEQYNG